jgi:hypothetical protein
MNGLIVGYVGKSSVGEGKRGDTAISVNVDFAKENTAIFHGALARA